MPENDRPAALIFDLDGTLAHTMPAHYFAWQRVSDEHGLGLTEDRFYATAGMPTADIVALLAAETGLTLDADVIGEQKEALFVERGLASVEPIQAVVDIARAHRGKLPMAVATSAFRWVAEKTLPQIGLADWFDALVTTEDVARASPPRTSTWRPPAAWAWSRTAAASTRTAKAVCRAPAPPA